MTVRLSSTLPAARRVSGFTYAIRNIVAEAQKAEAVGRTVRYLNIGDPVAFGFETPTHLIEAVSKAMHDGHNGYGPSAGLASAREAVAEEYSSRGMPVSADRVVLTAGTSEGIELALNAAADAGDEVLVPMPTYPLYTAVLHRIGARAVFYRTDPAHGWIPDVEHIRSLIRPTTRALVVIDPNNPTGAVYSREVRLALLDLADRHGVLLLADEVYGDLAFDGPVAPLASLAPDAPVVSFSSLSKGYLAPGWRAGWLAVGRERRLDEILAGIKKLADGRLCSTVPMQHAITAALTGDRSHQASFRDALRARADLTTARLNAIPGMSCTRPSAAFYAMPCVQLPPGTTDEQFVVRLLHETGVLVVHGSGFGLPASDGYFRVVFLAAPAALASVYDRVAEFTATFREVRRM